MLRMTINQSINKLYEYDYREAFLDQYLCSLTPGWL